LSTTHPSFEISFEAQKIRVEYQHLKRATINYYLKNLKLLFSRNPFVQPTSGQFSQILPNFTGVIDLLDDEPAIDFPLPDEFQNRNILVEIIGGGQTKSQAADSNWLSLLVVENYGPLRIADEAAGKALPTVSVKVYAA